MTTDSWKQGTDEVLSVFRMLATDERLAGWHLEINRDIHPWEDPSSTPPEWRIVVFYPEKKGVDAIGHLNYLSDFAKKNRLQLELHDGFVWLTPDGLGAE